VLAAASTADSATADRLAPHAADGARVPIQRRAAAFVADALAALDRGRLVLIDYGRTTAELAARPWHDWVRTYRAHQRGTHPLDGPGQQDITCEVAIDQLPPPDVDRSQAEFLAAHGLEQLAAEARRVWHERAAIGDLAALRARSTATEAAALSDPAGLGAFRVLEWIRW
jgi:SAM-dependent MidA family methyltransferase